MPDRAYPEDFVPGLSSADELNELSRGCIKAEERSSDGSGTLTLETIIDFEITVPAGRRQRLFGSTTIVSDLTGGVQVALYVDSVQKQRRNDESLGAGIFLSLDLIKDVQLSAGTHTIELVVGASGGDGNTVTSLANGSAGTRGVSLLYVDDVGPALS